MSDLNSVYAERNQLVALVAKMVIALGYAAGIRQDETEEPDWKNIVVVDLPTGQCSWHIHRREMPWFSFLGEYTTPWDGHTTQAKYDRVVNAEFPTPIRLENSGIDV